MIGEKYIGRDAKGDGSGTVLSAILAPLWRV
jgi:hypothetical protein